MISESGARCHYRWGLHRLSVRLLLLLMFSCLEIILNCIILELEIFRIVLMICKITFFFSKSVLCCLTIHFNLGSLEKYISTHIKQTFRYKSLEFTAEMNNNGDKTPIAFITFHTNYDYTADYQLRKTYFHTILCTMQCYDPKMLTI